MSHARLAEVCRSHRLEPTTRTFELRQHGVFGTGYGNPFCEGEVVTLSPGEFLPA
jgi:hypothetical protein